MGDDKRGEWRECKSIKLTIGDVPVTTFGAAWFDWGVAHRLGGWVDGDRAPKPNTASNRPTDGGKGA